MPERLDEGDDFDIDEDELYPIHLALDDPAQLPTDVLDRLQQQGIDAPGLQRSGWRPFNYYQGVAPADLTLVTLSIDDPNWNNGDKQPPMEVSRWMVSMEEASSMPIMDGRKDFSDLLADPNLDPAKKATIESLLAQLDWVERTALIREYDWHDKVDAQTGQNNKVHVDRDSVWVLDIPKGAHFECLWSETAPKDSPMDDRHGKTALPGGATQFYLADYDQAVCRWRRVKVMPRT